MKSLFLVAVTIAVGVLAWAAPSEAVAVACPILNSASCAGTLDYNPSTGVLTLHITNTGAGTFAGFGLETPGDQVLAGLLDGSDFWLICSSDCMYPDYDIQSGAKGSWIRPSDTLDLIIQ